MSSITKNPETKIALLIVEGPSDRTTFENSLRNYVRVFSNDNVRFDVVRGDLTLKDKNDKLISPQEIRSKIGDRVREFLKANSFRPSDLLLIGQICDLDACYASDECFVCDKSSLTVTYDVTSHKIKKDDIVDLMDKRHRKRDNLNTLYGTPYVNIRGLEIPYKLFYFGINLEHCLYEKPNCTDEEKENYAETFDEDHAHDSKKFEESLKVLPFISEDYLKSWDEKELSKKAFEPLTNICILLDWVKEVEMGRGK